MNIDLTAASNAYVTATWINCISGLAAVALLVGLIGFIFYRLSKGGV